MLAASRKVTMSVIGNTCFKKNFVFKSLHLSWAHTYNPEIRSWLFYPLSQPDVPDTLAFKNWYRNIAQDTVHTVSEL